LWSTGHDPVEQRRHNEGHESGTTPVRERHDREAQRRTSERQGALTSHASHGDGIMITNRHHLILLVSVAAWSAACADPAAGPATHSLRPSSGGGAAELTCEVKITPRSAGASTASTASTASPGVSAGSSGSILCRPNGQTGASAANRGAYGVTAGGSATVSARDSILEAQGTDISIQFDSVQITENFLTLVRTLTAWTSITNMLPGPIGTSDGVHAAASGTRVFFASGPSTLSGIGVVTVGNATGTGTFTSTGQQYFEYNGIIAPGASSGTIGWQFNSALAVNSFTFGIGVDAIVP
jgi:hypothetical protein